MKCVLPAVNVKLFAKATHCLAKLGSEIYFEPLEHGLALKTVNSSRSAYACFLFMRPLFQVYKHEIVDANEETGENFKCKVAVKTMLQVFKCLSTIERSVESCDMNLDDDACRLIFQLKCRHGIMKTHQLTFQECDSLQAVFAKDLSPNILKCEHKLLSDVVVNFSTSLEEISLCVNPCKVTLKSFVDGDDGAAALMRTEMSLNPEEFNDFQVGVDTDVTFSLKDFRAILAFCDVACMPVSLHFEVGGKPLIVSVEQEGYFRANFVLATISDEEFTSQGHHTNATANFTTNTTTNRSCASNGVNNNAKKQTGTTNPRGGKGKPPPQQVITNNEPRKINGASNVSVTEDVSPEIPLQNFDGFGVNPTAPSYQNMKNVFFAPTQDDEHSMVVLAPDSDEET